MSLTVRAALDQAKSALRGSDSPTLDAELILAASLRQSRTWLKTWPEASLTPDQEHQFTTLLDRRRAGEPIAYILGRTGFWSLDILCNPATLIPRPDTETLVELALDLPIGSEAQALDLGTGTGAIALALARENSGWQVEGVDRSADAVLLAERNAQLNAIGNAKFTVSNWFENLEVSSRFHLVVSNPPYVDVSDPHLDRGDVRFEPASALVAANGGLADLSLIIDQTKRFLHPGGWLVLEHGYNQGEFVVDCLRNNKYVEIQSKKDLGGQVRVTAGKLG